MNLSRTLIIGNSGAGKSWLAQALAARLSCAHLDLDSINWLADGYNQARERSAAIALAREAAAGQQWVIEGIYGWLAREILPAASALVWLDMPEQDCVANIHHRGRRGNASEQSFADLLDWAASYRSRNGSSAFGAHQALFDEFDGAKWRLCARDDVQGWLDSCPRS